MNAPTIQPSTQPPAPANYQERLEFLEFDGADARLLVDFGRHYRTAAGPLVERFYEHVLAFPRTRALLDEATLDRLKSAQRRHFEQLFGGEYGGSYAADRIAIGAVHQRVGLGPTWYVGAYALYLRLLLPAIIDHAGDDRRLVLAYLGAVIKAIFLDLDLALDAYAHATERDLRALKDRADRIVASVPAGLAVLDQQLGVVSSNRAFTETYARDASLAGRTLPQILGAPTLERHLREVATSGRSRTGLLLTLRAGGAARPARVAVAQLDGLAGDPARLLCAIEDLGPELNLTARLHASDQRLYEVIEHASDAMVLVRADGAVASLNRAAEELSGAPRAVHLGQPFLGLFGEAHHAAVRDALARCAAGPPHAPAPTRPPDLGAGAGTVTATTLAPLERLPQVELQRGDGTLVPVELQLRAERRDVDLVCVAVLRDLRPPRAAAPAPDDGFAAIVAHSPGFVAVYRQGRFVYLNPAAAALLGCDPADPGAAPALLEAIAPGDREAAAAALLAESDGAPAAGPVVLRLQHPGGGQVALRCVVQPLIFAGELARVLLGQEVPVDPGLPARLTQLDRLISAGTLAAGVAHALAPPVEHLAAELRLARSALGPCPPAPAGVTPARARVDAALDRADEHAAHVVRVVRHLRILTAAAPDRGVLVDVRNVLESVLELAQHEIAPGAQLVTEYGAVPLVDGSAAELAQVFLALVLNAAAAIPRGAPAQHTVRVRTFTQAGHAVVEVSDSGHGIPASAREHLFEPFFTTRPAGEGSGLGLAIAHRAVTALGGTIDVESAPGLGTTVLVRLPGARVELPAEDPASRGTPTQPRR